MGKMNPGMKMMAVTQARRRRDERGRYMEDEQDGRQMAGTYNTMPYMPQDRRNEMDVPMDARRRGNRSEMEDNYRGTRSEMEDNYRGRERTQRMTENNMPEDRYRRGMKGEGYFQWDNANMPPMAPSVPQSVPYMPPERYGQPHNLAPDWDNIEPDWEKRGANITDMRTYNRRDYPRGNMEHESAEKKSMIGFTQEGKGEHAKKLTKEKAEKWVKGMRTDDHKGGMWSMEDVKELAKEHDITGTQELVDFYAAMNMVYSDYSAVAKRYGVDREPFYAALACAFLYDKDGKAPSEKLAAYYEHVVPHEEEE